jgi:spore coat protein U-like protein
MKRIAVFTLASILMIAANAAHAVNCRWDIVPANINFGAYSAFGPSVSATSGFQFTCTPPAVGLLMLSQGAAGSYNPRRMPRTTAPAANVDYNLFMDAAHTVIWGDGTSGTQYLTFVPVPTNKTYVGTIYGNIPGGLDVPPGTYTDTIQATLDWGAGVDARFFTVTVTVAAECTVSTATLNFGAYDPVSANAITPQDSTSMIDVYCTKTTVATVALDNGLYFFGGNRRIQSGLGDFLNYQLYTDAGRSIIWNAVNTDSGTSTSKLTPINGGFTVYGRIFAGQDVRAGSFTDTVLVTVNY